MKTLFLLLTALFSSLVIKASDQLQSIENNAFTTGEKLTFKLYYSSFMTGNVTAVVMTSEINSKKYLVRGDTTLYVKVVGETKGAFNWFFKVHDVYQTFIDEKLLVPRYFKQRIKEGDYEASRDVYFFHEKGKAYYINNKNNISDTVPIGYNVQDLISAIYYARTFNADTLKINDKISIPFFLDDTVYNTRLKYIGKESVKTSLGTIKCLKFNPSVLTGGVFKDDNKLMVYISDDDNHLPVLAESEVMVGKVKIELIKYSGLKNKFSSKAGEH
jgi:hypothetical protein